MAQTPITYSGIVTTKDTLSKNEVYSRVESWIIETIGNINYKEDNQDSVIIKTMCRMRYVNYGVGGNNGSYATGYVDYNLNFIVLKGKFKYTFTNFIHTGWNKPWSYGLITKEPCKKIGWTGYFEDIKIVINTEVLNTTKSLKIILN